MNDDLYRYIASRRLGIPYEKVTPEQRAEAKARLYASAYGMAYPPREPAPLWLIVAVFIAPAFIVFMFAAMFIRWWLET